jgi:hypothetical protein
MRQTENGEEADPRAWPLDARRILLVRLRPASKGTHREEKLFPTLRTQVSKQVSQYNSYEIMHRECTL